MQGCAAVNKRWGWNRTGQIPDRSYLFQGKPGCRFLKSREVMNPEYIDDEDKQMLEAFDYVDEADAY
ncbi:hypothetical protein L21SP2_3161 [Salinispira pacifica]|uniref:Uncharacterized protein n=1 Tax=Salinispira pacifica TaxID=1307761 RepID=V5WMT5_9SPIO|nr:hypothetical protein L21SP2_3161 [Salinispira pacifica]